MPRAQRPPRTRDDAPGPLAPSPIRSGATSCDRRGGPLYGCLHWCSREFAPLHWALTRCGERAGERSSSGRAPVEGGGHRPGLANLLEMSARLAEEDGDEALAIRLYARPRRAAPRARGPPAVGPRMARPGAEPRRPPLTRRRGDVRGRGMTSQALSKCGRSPGRPRARSRCPGSSRNSSFAVGRPRGAHDAVAVNQKDASPGVNVPAVWLIRMCATALPSPLRKSQETSATGKNPGSPNGVTWMTGNDCHVPAGNVRT